VFQKEVCKMKGLTHFCTGVATATCFTQAMHMTVESSSLILLLGGLFGILPDTQDFKLAMFLAKNDYIIDPATPEYLLDSRNPSSIDAQKVADKMAEAINKCWDTGKNITLQMHTIQMGADNWRQYQVGYDVEKNETVVKLGSVVSMSQLPVHIEGTKLTGPKEGRGKTKCKILMAQARPSSIDIFNGPSFLFTKKKEGVNIVFLPWHRQWSHSATLGLIYGLIGWLIMGLVLGSFAKAWIYGAIITGGYFSHLLFDFTGFMGANIAWPFMHKRLEGGRFLKASNPLGNLFVIWGSAILVTFNINRVAIPPVFPLSPGKLFGFFWLLPFFLIMLMARISEEKKPIAGMVKKSKLAIKSIPLILLLGEEWREKVQETKERTKGIKRIGAIIYLLLQLFMRGKEEETIAEAITDEQQMENEEEFVTDSI